MTNADTDNKLIDVVVLQKNFTYKNRWQAGFGLRAIVCSPLRQNNTTLYQEKKE